MSQLEHSKLEHNKQVVVDYYRTAFEGNPHKAVEDHFGDRYIQHNPDADDGPEAFIGFVTWLRGQYPDLRLDIKRVLAEGDMVVTHSHLVLEPGEPGRARRLLPSGERQGRGALGRHPGRPGLLREPQRDVLTPETDNAGRPRTAGSGGGRVTVVRAVTAVRCRWRSPAHRWWCRR